MVSLQRTSIWMSAFLVSLILNSASAQIVPADQLPQGQLVPTEQAAQETPSLFSAITPETPKFKAAVDAFREKVIKLRSVAVRFTVDEDIAKDDQYREEFFALQRETVPYYHAMLAAAAEEFSADPKKRVAIASWLFTILKPYVDEDRFEGMLPVARALLNDVPDKPELNQMHFLTALALNEYAEAAETVERLEALGLASDDFLNFKNDVPSMTKDWEEELLIRAQDAKGEPLPKVILHTTKGPIEIELFENHAPETVANFIYLAEQGLYDDVDFHAWNPHILLQTGTIDDEPKYTIRGEMKEPNARKFYRGTIGMALAGEDLDSAYSEFFITMMPNTFFNGRYTAFGRVTAGMNVVGHLVKIKPEDPDDTESEKPEDAPDMILRVEIVSKRDHEYEPTKANDFTKKAEDTPAATTADKDLGAETAADGDAGQSD